MNNDDLADRLAGDIKRHAAVAIRRQAVAVSGTVVGPTSDEFRRNAMAVADGIQQLQDSERALREALDTATARIEQYQRAEHEYKIKVEAALLDVECERRRTEKVQETLTALRTRMEGIGRLAADALADLREDET